MQDSNDLLLRPKAIALNSRRFFFKYMSCETAMSVLVNRTLRWSTPAVLNDPYDMSFNLHVDVDFNRVKRMALDQSYNDHFGENPSPPGSKLGALIAIARQGFARKGTALSQEEFDAFFDSAIDESLAKVMPGVETAAAEVRPMLSRTKVLCLTTSPDNMLMWSHYANQHSGIVMRFETIPELDSPYAMAREIKYSPSMPHWIDEQGLADLLSGRGQSDSEKLLEKLVYTKSDHWNYEAEWRVSAGFGRDSEANFEDLHFGELELESLIFGCRIDGSKEEALRGAAKTVNPFVKFWNARPAKREFRMQILETS